MGDPTGRSDDPAAGRPDGVVIRPAASDEFLDVMRVLEGALLDVDAEAIEVRVDDGDVLVAVVRSDTDGRATAGGDRSAADDRSAVDDRSAADDRTAAEVGATRERVVGAAVSEPREECRHLEAVAVRRSRRRRGIGSALVERAIRVAAARDDADRLTASFDAELRPFYADLGFEIERRDDRLWGERPL